MGTTVKSYHQYGEALAHQEVCGPVGAASHGDGGRPGPLGEQLRRYEPWNRPRTDFKKGHQAKNGQDRNITGHRRFALLKGEKEHRQNSVIQAHRVQTASLH